MAAVARAVRLRRVVRRMRIVEVNPAKKWRLPLFQPAHGGGYHLVRPAFRSLALRHRALRSAEGIIVDIEPAVQAEAGCQYIRPDEGGGLVSARLEPLRQSGDAGREHKIAIVPDG